MTMIEWAENEIRLACAREKEMCENEPEVKSGVETSMADYGCGCYQSALNAYKSLMNDEHSGMSFSITAGILKRLLDGFPLTPIKDEPEIWGMSYSDGTRETYQCTRMFSLFKTVDKKTGRITYSDVERSVCVDERGITYHNGFVDRKLDELYPITLPYMPRGRYYVYVSECDTEGKPGCFDTMSIQRVKKPDGTVDVLGWHYKETPDGWLRISDAEYQDRCKLSAESTHINE